MIITMEPNASDEAVEKVTNLIESKRLTAHLSKGSQVTTVDVIGGKTKLLDINTEISEGVDKVVAVTKSYKLVNKKLHPEDFMIPVGNTHIGSGTMTVMAGLCAIESLDQLLEIVHVARKAGATFLRSGAYKPRIPLYSLQGPEEEGLKYMKAAREATSLNVVCEATSAHTIESVVKYANMLQIGVRNTQNSEPLREASKSGTPVLLKRGLCATIDEWLNAAEYITFEGNPNAVLCERDIRIYEASTRNTLDISAVPVIRQKSHLPVTVDPSHAVGVKAYVKPLAKAAITVGVDGLMIEVHPCPAKALSDDPRPLAFDVLEQLMKDLALYAEPSGRTFKAQ